MAATIEDYHKVFAKISTESTDQINRSSGCVFLAQKFNKDGVFRSDIQLDILTTLLNNTEEFFKQLDIFMNLEPFSETAQNEIIAVYEDYRLKKQNPFKNVDSTGLPIGSIAERQILVQLLSGCSETLNRLKEKDINTIMSLLGILGPIFEKILMIMRKSDRESSTNDDSGATILSAVIKLFIDSSPKNGTNFATFCSCCEGIWTLIKSIRGKITGSECVLTIAQLIGLFFGSVVSGLLVNFAVKMRIKQFPSSLPRISVFPMEIFVRFLVGMVMGRTTGRLTEWLFDIISDVETAKAHKFVGVKRSSSADEINEKFLQLLLQNHPEKHQNKLEKWNELKQSMAIILASRGE